MLTALLLWQVDSHSLYVLVEFKNAGSCGSSMQGKLLERWRRPSLHGLLQRFADDGGSLLSEPEFSERRCRFSGKGMLDVATSPIILRRALR
jgi:hypothetical protein